MPYIDRKNIDINIVKNQNCVFCIFVGKANMYAEETHSHLASTEPLFSFSFQNLLLAPNWHVHDSSLRLFCQCHCPALYIWLTWCRLYMHNNNSGLLRRSTFDSSLLYNMTGNDLFGGLIDLDSRAQIVPNRFQTWSCDLSSTNYVLAVVL